MSLIVELEQEIRDRINHHRKQYELLQDRASWFQVCTSLDVLGDSQMAISSYKESEWPEDAGQQYLFTYGIMQALYLQQLAVRHIAEALNLPFEQDSTLSQISEIRNNSTGHPTKRRNGTYHFISRATMSQGGFTLISSDPKKTSSDIRGVNLFKLLEQQEEVLHTKLTEILEVLQAEENKHKERFASMPLSEIFHPSVSYMFQKVFEGIHNDSVRPIGKVSLESVQNTYSKFQKALEERGEIPANDHLVYELDEMEHPFKRLNEFFNCGPSDSFSSEDAYIFAFFLREKHKEFIKIAKEIDEQYETKG